MFPVWATEVLKETSHELGLLGAIIFLGIILEFSPQNYLVRDLAFDSGNPALVRNKKKMYISLIIIVSVSSTTSTTSPTERRQQIRCFGKD